MKPLILIPLVLLLVIAAFLIGRTTHAPPRDPAAQSTPTPVEAAPAFWTCSMHPNVRQPGPGQCPLCGMDLVPVTSHTDHEGGSHEIRLSTNAVARAGIETEPVRRHLPTAEVRMVGKVDYDETRVSSITARVRGRLDRLYVDYTGIRVNEGEHLVSLYSPDLLNAQQELLETLRTAGDLQASPDTFLKERMTQTVEAAREKLRLWGLSDAQVREIEARQSASDHITLNAPIGGIVVQKNAMEGMYVSEGTPIYTIADLSHLWVRLDAYESDLQWLHFGQAVEFSTEAYPGERFTGWISFIDPVLNAKTRTLKVRVNVDNTDGRLKPEMFVRAVVKSQVTGAGKVMSPDLAGKWIGPMHPEVVRDEPGPCPICGMPLIQAESLGYSAATNEPAAMPLVIPATAPLITGKRAVVYVASTNQPGVFEGRTVELGPRASDFYLVKSGLAEGELVVTRGAFKVDSAVQILAKPSMMNPDEAPAIRAETPAATTAEPHAAPEQFQQQLRATVDAYFPVADALSHDDLEAAQASASTFHDTLNTIEMSLLEGEAHMAWMKALETIETGVNGLKSALEIEAARAAFEQVSNGLIAAADRFGLTGDTPAYIYHCPMAFDGRGADWLQNKQGTENPYYGSAMFSCGAKVRGVGERD